MGHNKMTLHNFGNLSLYQIGGHELNEMVEGQSIFRVECNSKNLGLPYY